MPLEKLRCLECGKVLGEAEIITGKFKKICPKCKSMNEWDFIEIVSLMENKFTVERKLIQRVDKK